MKILAYILNVAFIIFLFISVFSETKPSGRDIFLLCIFFLFATINVTALFLSSNGKNILSLFLERKRLEQEQKLNAIKEHMGK